MRKSEPIEGLSDAERALLGEALRALRAERRIAWNAACNAAEAARKRRPSLRPYGIDDIKASRGGICFRSSVEDSGRGGIEPRAWPTQLRGRARHQPCPRRELYV